MNKKLWIIISAIILAIVIIVFGTVFGKKKYQTSVFEPGINKLATQNIAIVYHPYNSGIKQIADIIESKVGGDVYLLEPFSDYPTSPDLRKDRIKNEQLHPEKVSLKDTKFDLKKYNIIFIGVPVIDNMMSPVMMRFVLDNEKLFNKDVITIPFIFVNKNESATDSSNFIFRHTGLSSQKNSYTTSFQEQRANEIYVTNWLEQIPFHRYEIKKPSKEKAEAYKQALQDEREAKKKAKELRSVINKNNRNSGEKNPIKPKYSGF